MKLQQKRAIKCCGPVAGARDRLNVNQLRAFAAMRHWKQAA